MNRPQVRARVRERGTVVDVLSPGVGLWCAVAAPGTLVGDGAVIGRLEVLGRAVDVVSPRGGVVVSGDARPQMAHRPVDHGAVLLTVDALAAVSGARPASSSQASATGDLAVFSPSSGRFYARPGPDKAPFVAVGDELVVGQTICLLEVMKTFNRIAFSGEGFPERVRVVAIEPEDGDDLEAGQLILTLEAIS